ncbi:FIST signal transduction protein [Algibacter sp. PT7-4]|uniref:FIST signal transduction protein n=1 Tax=Algibacter ulvanivorans TaxID=3400999 RepID=UPI003AAA9246
MKTVQLRKYKDKDWEFLTPPEQLVNPLVLVFGKRIVLEDSKVYTTIKKIFPDGHIVFGSTGGNITANSIYEDCLTVTAIQLEKSTFNVEHINLSQTNLNSYDAGVRLVNNLKKDDLKYILVISDGSFVNGSELIKGMNNSVSNNVLITGGLCADNIKFERTLVSYNENPKDGEIVAIGFYGEHIEISSSISDGWQPFGPERIITKSKGNILYELDNKPALDLYKKYLGDKANNLPASALHYPLLIKTEQEDLPYIRSILNINKEYNAMIFAGDVPLNSKAQLMMTSADNLIKATQTAIQQAYKPISNKPQLALLVSGVGRKIKLNQRVIEEVQEVNKNLEHPITVCGFYGYGEIAPLHEENMCKMHSQSIAITFISE